MRVFSFFESRAPIPLTKNVAFWAEAPIVLTRSNDHFMLNRPLKSMGALAVVKKLKKNRNQSSEDLCKGRVKNIVIHRDRHFLLA